MYLFSDRFVILGNHRDAWVFGGVDPNSGTAVLMELARALSKLRSIGRQNYLVDDIEISLHIIP